MSMWPSTSTSLVTAGQRAVAPPLRISILPNGEFLPAEVENEFQLYPQASTVFGALASSNEFVGELNTFRDIMVRQIHVTSDRSRKEDVERLRPDRGTDVVRTLPAFTYTVDGSAAAGLMADTAPDAHVRRVGGDGGSLSLDYNSMLAYLWASVQDAHNRLDAMERTKTRRKRKERAL